MPRFRWCEAPHCGHCLHLVLSRNAQLVCWIEGNLHSMAAERLLFCVLSCFKITGIVVLWFFLLLASWLQCMRVDYLQGWEVVMRTVRYHLLVNIMPVVLLLSFMAVAMAGVNILLS